VGLLGDTDTVGPPRTPKIQISDFRQPCGSCIGICKEVWNSMGAAAALIVAAIHESVEGGLNTSTRHPDTNTMSLDSGIAENL